MKQYRFVKALLAYFMCLFFQAEGAEDFRIWNELIVSHRLNPCWSMDARFVARFRDNASRVHLYYTEVNFVRDLSNGWLVIPGYRETYRKLDSGKWVFEAIPNAAVVHTIEVGSYHFFQRSRVEYHSREGFWRYRQRAACDFPVWFNFLNIQPTFYGELFFREGEGFDQCRFFSGLKSSCSQLSEIVVGYFLREERNARNWMRTNILFLTGQLTY